MDTSVGTPPVLSQKDTFGHQLPLVMADPSTHPQMCDGYDGVETSICHKWVDLEIWFVVAHQLLLISLYCCCCISAIFDKREQTCKPLVFASQVGTAVDGNCLLLSLACS